MASRWVTTTPWALVGLLSCQRSEHRARIELASPRYDGGILPLDEQCLFVYSVGSEGLEPSPPWLRATYAAANTLIPFVVCPAFAGPNSGSRGNRTHRRSLIRRASPTRSRLPWRRSPSRGTENRTLLSRLKAGCFAKKLHPHGKWGMRFNRIRVSISSLLFFNQWSP